MQQISHEHNAYGTRMCIENGLLHRLDGPAVEYANGTQYWFIDGVEYTKDQFQLVTFVMSQVTV